MNPRGQRIAKIAARIERAEAAMIAVLEKEWPVGTLVKLHIMRSQLNPTRGEVVSHEGGRYAYLRVRLIDSPTQQVRSVPARNVF